MYTPVQRFLFAFGPVTAMCLYSSLSSSRQFSSKLSAKQIEELNIIWMVWD